MTRDELIEKLDAINYSHGILESETNTIEIADFVLANFVPKSKRMWEGKLTYDSWSEGECGVLDGQSLTDIAEQNDGKQAILIIKDE